MQVDLTGLTKFLREEIQVNEETIQFITETLTRLYEVTVGTASFFGFAPTGQTVVFFQLTHTKRGERIYPQVCSVYQGLQYDALESARWNFAVLRQDKREDGYYWGEKLIAPLPSEAIIDLILKKDFAYSDITREEVEEAVVWVLLTGMIPREFVRSRIWRAYKRYEDSDIE